jgi:hypothetical protein
LKDEAGFGRETVSQLISADMGVQQRSDLHGYISMPASGWWHFKQFPPYQLVAAASGGEP